MGSRHAVVGFALALAPILVACGEKFTSAPAQPGGPDAGQDAPASPGGSGGASGIGGDGGSGGSAAEGGDGGTAGVADSSPPDGTVDPAIPRDGLLLWLRADRGVALTSGDVATWSDQSRNAADATQAAPERRPRLARTEPGGGASLEFDGIDDFLDLPSGFADFSAGVSIFAVALHRASDVCVAVLHLSNGSEEADLNLGVSDGRLLYEVDVQANFGDPVPADVPLLWAVVHQPDHSYELRLNRQPAGSGESGLPEVVERAQNSVANSLYAGCGTFPGQIAEVLVYARAVSPPELDAIEEYLQTRVGS